MTFWEIFLEAVAPAAAAATVALAVQAIVAIAKYVVPLIKQKMGESQFALAKDTVKMIVRAIEQSPAYSEWDGAAKKQRAIVSISNWFESKGLPITAELLDGLIESAVQEMNSDLGELVTVMLPEIDPAE
jgi:hypothetical protein